MSDTGGRGRLRISFDDVPDEVPREVPVHEGADDLEVSLRPRAVVRAPYQARSPTTADHPVPTPPPPGPAASDDDALRFDGFEYATWVSRVGAALIDWLVLFAGTLLLMMLFTLVLSSGLSAGGVLGMLMLVWLLISLVQMAYAPTFMAREMPYNGQTLGKQLLGLRVRRTDGRQMWFWFGVLRNVVVFGLLFGFLGSLLFGIPLLLDVLWPLWDSKRRCLHDIIVSTVVTREP